MLKNILLTYYRLGLRNLLRVFVYRLRLKTGLIILELPLASPIYEDCFEYIGTSPMSASGENINTLEYFGSRVIEVEEKPDWFWNNSEEKNYDFNKKHWSKIPDFIDSRTDVKFIWEPSRFHWLVRMAVLARSSISRPLFSSINIWLVDWNKKNPANSGPNWKCGQEASIRLINLVLASHLMSKICRPNDALKQTVVQHLTRISATLEYAIAQDNNHGTSEAAALIIGAGFLKQWPDYQKKARKWFAKGHRQLESRVERLVFPDGSFSQYSVNYHRLFLDTISLVEYFRNEYELKAFTKNYYTKAEKATLWLYSLIERESGEATNIGANDGAWLLSFVTTPYRDYRPSVQLASTLFLKRSAYQHYQANEILNVLDVPAFELKMSLPVSEVYKDGGYAVLVDEENEYQTKAVIRFPRYRFRPGHADALHADIWHKGKNWFRDTGTYSYNTESNWIDYFSGTKSHNTIQFDDRNQMPKISRFLFSDWLETESFSLINCDGHGREWNAAYEDSKGCNHRRSVSLSAGNLKVRDNVGGFKHKAILRWILSPDCWEQDGYKLSTDGCSIEIESDTAIARFEIVEGWESLYYGLKTQVEVLEVEVHNHGQIVSNISFI